MSLTSAMSDLYSAPDRTADIGTEPSTATPRTVDFSNVKKRRQHKSGVLRDIGVDPRPRTPEGKLLTPKQIRARARRRYKKAQGGHSKEIMTTEELHWLYKPLEEWTIDELAAGRPMAPDGSGFKGPKPKWITQEVHEEAMDRFAKVIKGTMNEHTVDALETIQMILSNEEVDNRGRPLVSANTKLDAAKFLLEHVVGKPKQHVTQDISVKLQGLLGSVMVNPNTALAPPEFGGQGSDTGPAYSIGHYPGHTIPIGAADDIVDAEFDEEEEFDE